MNKNLPMKEEKGLVGKIKRFLKKIFYKPNQIKKEKNIEKDKSDEIKENQNENFAKNMKVEVDNSIYHELERNELFQKIRRNHELLNMLNSKQLESLSKYYDKVIEKNNEIIQNKKVKLKKVS